MTLFHPKLRRALLKDREHKDAGLTSEKLLFYEGLVAKLFYTEHFPARQQDGLTPRDDIPIIIRELVDEILDFRRDLMPRYDEITREFVENQKKIINNRYHDLGVGKTFKDSFINFWFWILAVLFNSQRKPGIKTPVLRIPHPPTHKNSRKPEDQDTKPCDDHNQNGNNENDEERDEDEVGNSDNGDKSSNGPDFKSPVK